MQLGICSSLLVSMLLLPGTASSQEYELLRDLNQIGDADHGSEPSDFTEWNGRMLFTARDGLRGRELWITDGANVSFVADLWPGANSSSPRSLRALGNKVYFLADDGVHGRELMCTDGTAQGTGIVLDLSPGPASSDIRSLCVAAGKLFFRVGTDLYVSDGTAAGTKLLQDPKLPARFVPSTKHALLAAEGGIYFFADDNVLGSEPWFSDGEVGKARFVADVAPGPESSAPDDSSLAAAIGTGIAYVASSKTNPGRGELFYVDRIGQKRVLLDSAQSKQENPQFEDLRAVGARLWLRERHSMQRPRLRLWVSEPAAGALRIVTSAKDGNPIVPSEVFMFGKKARFFAEDAQGRIQLWEGDGTTGGTFVSFDFPHTPWLRVVRGQAAASTRIYFWAVFEGDSREHLWQSDGTLVGTQPCRYRAGEIVQDLRQSWSALSALGDRAVFSFDDGRGYEPWVSDGAPSGTWQLANILGPIGIGSGDPKHVNRHGDRIYFAANDYVHGSELWSSDGTAQGTKLVADIRPGGYGSSPEQLASGIGKLFFVADDGVHGRELWCSDGTAQGTRMVMDLTSGKEGTSVGGFLEFDGLMLFGSWPLGLHVTDGTAAGTKPFDQAFSGANLQYSSEVKYARAGNQLYLYVRDSQKTTIYRCPAGSRTLLPLALSGYWPRCDFIGSLDGSLVFALMHNDMSQSLWQTRGTATTTSQILTRPQWAAALVDRDVLWVLGPDGKGAVDLLQSDGTAKGTRLVRSFPTANPSSLNLIDAIGSRLYFTPGHEHGLYVSDGTATGTQRLTSFVPSRLKSTAPDRMWFIAGKTPLTSVPWFTDGTPQGTYEVATKHSVPALDYAAFGQSVAGRVVIVGSSPVNGVELFLTKLGAGRHPIGRSCGANDPWIDCTAPELGSPLVIDGGSAPASSIGVFALGGNAGVGAALPGVGCRLHVDLATMILLHPFAVTQPGWQLQIPIPNQTSLQGLRLAMQTVYLGAKNDWQATAGMQLLLGR